MTGLSGQGALGDRGCSRAVIGLVVVGLLVASLACVLVALMVLMPGKAT